MTPSIPPTAVPVGSLNSSSASGAYELSYRVRRFIYVSALGRTVDCVEQAAHCIIAVSDFFATATLVKVPITFAPRRRHRRPVARST